MWFLYAALAAHVDVQGMQYGITNHGLLIKSQTICTLLRGITIYRY